MKKSEAIELLGGTVSAAADAIGVTYQAVDKWPDELSPRIADRVIAAIARKRLGDSIAKPALDTRPLDGERIDPDLQMIGPNHGI